MAQEFTFGCAGDCPYFKSVTGSCTHDNQQAIATFLRKHPGKRCPMRDRDNS